MLSPEQEEQVIAQALRRGLLKPEQVELHAPENRSPADPRLQSYRSVGVMLPSLPGQPAGAPSTTSGKPVPSRRSFPPTYGPRLDRLRKLGLIDDATIEELRSELRSLESTTEAESASAVTSDEQPAVPTGENPAPLANTATPPHGAPVTVRVQLPLPDALRRWTRYEITEVLGQGGMGVVYKARDRRLGRTVALKFIRLADPKMVQRFVNEARAQARITHDNICKVYEVDEVASQPYIAMEYVDGQSVLGLNDKLSLIQKVRLIQDVAEALHSAHRLGIIHRDIKPQNVLVEQKPDGRLRPVLMDFGLARDVRSRLNLTETGIVLGTPEYMSPEQARGTSGDGSVDCRTDVYSLGAMLYEMLVGQPPFEGSTSVQVLISVLNDQVVPVRTRNPSIPEPLETIVMKCLTKDAEGRYATARAMAQDLGRYLAGEPIQAQPPPPPPTPVAEPVTELEPPPGAQRWWPAILAGLLLLTLSAILIIAVRARFRQAADRRFAEEQARQAVLFQKDVREMELFMRAAYELPLHNLRSEQDLLRQQVARIEKQIETLGPVARGPGEYALGRAAMLLDQWTSAEQHFSAALRAGYNAGEVHLALGVAHGLRYQRAADEARRSLERTSVGQRLRELEAQFLVPARRELEQSGGVVWESAAYTQALLQHFRRHYDAALASVSRANGEAPWLYEIVQLEARILRERAAQSDTKELVLFAEYDLKRAGEILGRAIDMARSDPFLYLELAELGMLMMRQRSLAHQPIKVAYDQVIGACQNALVAQPDLAVIHSLLASAEAAASEDQLERGEDPRQALERGQTALAEAQRLAPGESAQFLAANRLSRVQIGYQLRRGQDALPALLRAEDSARDGVLRNSSFASLWVDVGQVHVLRADYQATHGQDPRPEFEQALSSFQKALAIQPREATAHTQLGLTELRLARRSLRHGEDPVPHLRRARESFNATMAIVSDDADAVIGMAEAETIEAEYRSMTGGLALPLLSAAVHGARAALKQYPSVVDASRVLAQALRHEAQWMLLRGQDPTPMLTEALQAMAAANKLRPGDPDLLALEGEMHMLQSRWQQKQRRSIEPDLKRALAALNASLQVNERRASTYISLARVAKVQAEAGTGAEGNAAILRGLVATSKALEISPGSPRALLVQGELQLLQALRAPVAERASLAEPSLAALSQAIKLNPLLGYEAGASRDRAQALLSDPRASRAAVPRGTPGARGVFGPGPQGPNDQKR